jgi:bifunctional non-homologous end joining protein LigD
MPYPRRGNDWTNRFRKIAADVWNINAGSAIIDGEVVVPAANGTMIQKDCDGRVRSALPQRLRPSEAAAV